MWNIAIVEDEDASRDVLIRYLHQYEKEHNLALTLHTFPDGLRFLEGYQCDYSIVFLDIEMPFLSGMETAKRLRALDDAVCLVFVTNVAQYAVEGYTVQAAGYLLKPVAYYQFSVMLEKLMLTLDRRERSELLLPVSGGMERVDVAAVLYVEVRNHWLYYHTVSGEPKVVRGTMGDAEQQLAPLGFARCSQSYLVNLKYVERVRSDAVLVGGEALTISRARRKPFLKQLTDYLGGVN